MKGAIVVPYRDRKEHLATFIPHYRKVTPELDIYIAEQGNDKPFKRGELFNRWFVCFGKKYDYMVMHDVDMIVYPEDARYDYHDTVLQLATQAEQFGWKMPYPEYLGGVTLMPCEIFERVNGFSNEMQGWGAEDDLLYKRLKKAGVRIDYHNSRYECLKHERDISWDLRNKNIEIAHRNDPDDGLNGLTPCEAVMRLTDDYTYIKFMM